ncbi:MAG: thiamine-phosphate kinase [Chloroflexi bacterium]|nr:thiamine-phosphate kinase [Chloroflexota bacterium]
MPGIMRAMLVRDIGEFPLIDRLAQTIGGENSSLIQRLDDDGFRTLLTIGDDAAAWQGPPGIRVLTTDTMVEGVHFNLDYTDWRDLGWKSLATNLSDIAAMGCRPTYSIVTLGLRGDLPVEGLLDMYRGLMDVATAHGGAIVGGDIVKSPVFFVTVALEGAAPFPNSRILRRDAAKPGDLIAVTGHLGCSGGGLRMLQTGADFPDALASRHLRDAHNRPVPQVKAGLLMAEHGVTTAMDVSDGLLNDLTKICTASNVSAMLNAGSIPADDILKAAFPDDWLNLALGGGEDYELLFTAPADVMHGLRSALDVPMSVIGEVVAGEGSVNILDDNGSPMAVPRGGWDHFEL